MTPRFTARALSSDGEGVGTLDVSRVDVGRTTVTVPDTIPGADDSDQSAALQQFFDEAGDGVDIHVPRLFRFDAAGPILQYRKDVRVFGEGGFTTPTDGRELEPTPLASASWPRSRARFLLIGSDDCAVEQILLEGSNQANREMRGYVEDLEAQHGIDIAGCRRLRIDGVRIRFVRGDYVCMSGGPREDGTREWSEDITVRRGDFTYNGRQGFAITGVENALIEECVTDVCRRTLIDFESNRPGGGAVGVTFRRNKFGRSHLTFLAIHRRGTLEQLSFIENEITEAHVITPSSDRDLERGWRTRITDLKLIGNVSSEAVGNPQLGAWRLDGVDGLEVRDNRIAVAVDRGMHLMLLRDCTGVVESGNRAVSPDGTKKAPIIHPDSQYESA